MKAAWIGGVLVVLAVAAYASRDYSGIPDIPVARLQAAYGADSHYVDVLGAQVRVKESGQGEPLLLLHGFAASADTWDGWRKQLSDRYHVIAVDIPPFAITGPLPGRTADVGSLQLFMDALVDRLQLSRFDLAGNSLGGYIAWNYALRHPEHVHKLILVDSAGYPGPDPLPVRLMKMPVIGEVAAHFSPWPVVAASIHDVYGNPALVTRAEIRRYQDMMRREGSRRAVVTLVRSLHFDPAPIRQLAVPTLIMWGGRDRWIPPEDAKRFHDDIPGSRLIMYDRLGHIPMEEDPGHTATDAARFLQS